MSELEQNLLIYLEKVDKRNQDLAEQSDLKVTDYRIRSLKIELNDEYDVQTTDSLSGYNECFKGINKLAKEISKTFEAGYGLDFRRMALQLRIKEARTQLRKVIDHLEKKLMPNEE